MDWTALTKIMQASGPVAVIAVILIWQNINQSKKLMQIIETNTKAMTEMKDMIKTLVDKMHC